MANATKSNVIEVPADVTRHIAESFIAGDVVVNIGQVDKPTERFLNKMDRAGIAVKWRGKWYPTAGASWGLGPDKTCWALSPEFNPKCKEFGGRTAAAVGPLVEGCNSSLRRQMVSA